MQVSKDKEYWDPLKLVEKDREQAIENEEEMLKLQELEAASFAASQNSGQDDQGAMGL